MTPTRSQILAADARQLNEWAMEHIMGWTRDIDQDGEMWGWIGQGAPWGADAEFEPASDRNAAAEVVERLRKLIIESNSGLNGVFISELEDLVGPCVIDMITASPAQICRAALLAAGGGE